MRADGHSSLRYHFVWRQPQGPAFLIAEMTTIVAKKTNGPALGPGR
jgi:hypothetical protein